MYHGGHPKMAHAGSILEARKKPVIVCGDFNVSHTELDLARPKENVGNAGFTPEEREKFGALLAAGFVDSFRLLHPDERAYSWWSYRGGARARNIGWRLDYFLVSDFARDKIRRAEIRPDILGSDHCPVSLDIDL